MSKERSDLEQNNNIEGDGKFVSFIRRNNPDLTDVEIERLRQTYESYENGDVISDPFRDPDYFRLTGFRRIPGVVILREQT
jgi:hypothetical protein